MIPKEPGPGPERPIHSNPGLRATSQVVETEWAMVFTLSAGKIARFHNFVDTHAVAAAHRGS